MVAIGSVAALVLVACGGTTDATGTPAGRATATPTQVPARGSPTPTLTGGLGAAPTPPPSEVDPCTLVTKAEAATVLGTAPGEPTRRTVPLLLGRARYDCTYDTPDARHVSVSAFVYRDASEAGRAVQAAIAGGSYAEIPGVGERAYATPGNQVIALRGRYTVGVAVSTGRDAGDQNAAKDLVAKALTRLP